MNLNFRFNALRAPRINILHVEGSIQRVRQLAKPMNSPESSHLRNLKEEIKQQLIALGTPVTFEQFEQAINVEQRERIGMGLYRDNPDVDWLPSFDESVARSLLGTNGAKWHGGRRQQATHLFFETFGRLPALETLCCRLLESYGEIDAPTSGPSRLWHQERVTLFAHDGPQKIADSARTGETLNNLMERFGIDRTSRHPFSSRLKECFLLTRLENAALGQGEEILQDLENIKNQPYEAGVPMGAAALRIMTKRVLAAGGVWNGNWTDWILRLGCDPGLPPSSSTFGIWWGCWNPSRAELECARRGVNRQTLEYFIQFLENSLKVTGNTAQFKARAGFLRWLDTTDKIRKFKLLLHPSAFYSLPKAYRDQMHRIAEIEGSGQETSVIVIECDDEMWLVEGTHSFALRAFHKRFPVPEVFQFDQRIYSYRTFTQGEMHKYTCTGIWKAHMGNWIPDFLAQVRSQFRVEWAWRY